MKCANSFCIYENEGECILDEVSLDYDGRCEDCMQVTIDDGTLKELKEKILKRK